MPLQPPSTSAQTVWLLDLDNTLHDASWRVFPLMNAQMTAFIERHLGVAREEANRIRAHFWQRYGATLLGLMHEHGVDAAQFLRETHDFPHLPRMLRCDGSERAALARLPGRKLVLTNAPRDYARRVLKALKLWPLIDGLLAVEDMWMFHNLRPKPDARMLRHVLARHGLRPAQCVLVEDTPGHLQQARRIGLRGAWMVRYARRAQKKRRDLPMERTGLHSRPAFVTARIHSLNALRHMR
jgi:putative hydrolase of the HAD superfamily